MIYGSLSSSDVVLFLFSSGLLSVLLIPLLQLLRPTISSSATDLQSVCCVHFDVLSTRIPAPGLGLARPCFTLGAELPCYGDDGGDDSPGNDGVALPVGRLGVPTSGR